LALLGRRNNGRRWKWIAFTQNQNSLGMTEISPNISPKYEIGQNAFNFVQIHGQALPLEGSGDVDQAQIGLLQNQINAFKEVAVTHRLGFF
jgi:hypothetical protein